MGCKPIKTTKTSLSAPADLITDIERMIEEARAAAATTVNAGLTLLNWRIGRRIRNDVLQRGRADYGKGIVVALSRQLAERYGDGFNEKNLRRMIQFAEVFPEEEPPLGLILCAEGSREQIELLELDKSGIHVAEYLTVLPPKDLLKRKLHDAITRSQKALEHRGEPASDKETE
jgi:hypothetical protein